MSYKEAQKLYKLGKYNMEPPPVHTTSWTEEDWIYYIFKVTPPGPSNITYSKRHNENISKTT